jgi:cytochrome c
MFDTMTLTKIVGGVCGSLLIFLFGAWAASSIYGLGEPAHGEEHALSYSVEGAETEAEAEPVEAVAEVPFAEVFAVADAAAGEKVFGKCKACHNVEGKDGVGPHLNGVVGRDHGAVDGFNYSEALLARKGTPWSEEEIYAFLQNPKVWMPGTKMSFAGLPKPEDRANVVAYLATLQ